MAIELITGKAGVPHVSSDDVGAFNANAFGDGVYRLNGCKASIVNANTVNISAGNILVQGRHVRISGDGVNVSVENGSSGVTRIDVIGLLYSRDQNGVENVEAVAFKGVPGSNPEPPSLSGSIIDGSSTAQVGLFRVTVSASGLSDLEYVGTVDGSPVFGLDDGPLPVKNGGTGFDNYRDAADSLVNSLPVSEGTPKDGDYYVSQYAGTDPSLKGRYYRRPVVSLWEYIKSKGAEVFASISHSHSDTDIAVGEKTLAEAVEDASKTATDLFDSIDGQTVSKQRVLGIYSTSGPSFRQRNDSQSANMGVTHPTSAKYFSQVTAHDSNDNVIGRMSSYLNTNGLLTTRLSVERYDKDGANVAKHGVSLGISDDRSFVTSFDNPEAWRAGLGLGKLAVKDTITNNDVSGVDISKLSGTLAPAHGGTGQTSERAAANSMAKSLQAIETAVMPNDNDYVVLSEHSATGARDDSTFVRRQVVVIWNYVKAKIKSVLGLDATSFGGNSATATKLITARTIRTNLGSTDAASFNGTANVTPGITGTLAPGHGGTGQTSLRESAKSLIDSLQRTSAVPYDTDYIVCNMHDTDKHTTIADSFGLRSITYFTKYFEGALTDKVVAAGSSGNWRYIRFASGMAICAGRFTKSIQCNDDFGGWYYDSSTKLGGDSYPFTFSATPSCHVIPYDTGILTASNVGGSTSAAASVYAIHRTKHSSSTSCGYSIIAVGRKD